MEVLIILSVGLNLIVILSILYLYFMGKKHVQEFFVNKIINIRHEQKVTMFRSCPTTDSAIVFLGDSITEGGQWSELFENDKILNRGIGGDITSGVLARIDEVIRHQPLKVFICIGTNDLARGNDIAAIIADYELIIKSIQEESPQTQLYIQSVLPVGEKVLYGHKNDTIIILNNEIQKMCERFSLPYLDIYSEMLNEKGVLKAEYTNDQLHIQGTAYLVWKKAIANYIGE